MIKSSERECGGRVEVVVIGVSTGGPTALEAMLSALEEDFPVPVLVVQHMPKLFTYAMAKRLDRFCALRLREAFAGAELGPGTIWLAPGDACIEIARAVRRMPVLRLSRCASSEKFEPSVDLLFRSAAETFGSGTLAVVMTGMGSDGLDGALRIREAGGTVLVQDRKSSAVWGMPGRVFEAGIAEEALPLDALAEAVSARAWLGRMRDEVRV